MKLSTVHRIVARQLSEINQEPSVSARLESYKALGNRLKSISEKAEARYVRISEEWREKLNSPNPPEEPNFFNSLIERRQKISLKNSDIRTSLACQAQLFLKMK